MNSEQVLRALLRDVNHLRRVRRRVVETATPLVVFEARWHAVSFPNPVPPGASSEPQSTVPASANTAWALLAPGWDATSDARPTSFVVLESRKGFDVHLNDTLHIPVDDTTFVGNCATGNFLSEAQADFITQRVFPKEFSMLGYEAATCMTTTIGDAGPLGAQ